MTQLPLNAGIYDDMSNSDYHACEDWVSSSGLKRLLPDHCKSGGSADALDFGSAFHTLVLGVGDPIEWVDAASWQGKDAKDRRVKAYEAGMIPILLKEKPRLDSMREAVLSHPVAGPMLEVPGRSELSIFADVDGVRCRARFDRLTDDGVGVDLKTTSAGPGVYGLTRAVLDYGYDVSADHYWRVATAAGVDVNGFGLVFCSKDAPHFVTVVELDESFYERASVLRDLALDRLLHPGMVEAYPGAEERLTLTTPRWAAL